MYLFSYFIYLFIIYFIFHNGWIYDFLWTDSDCIVFQDWSPCLCFGPTIQSSKNNLVTSKAHIHFWAPSKKAKEIPETDYSIVLKIIRPQSPYFLIGLDLLGFHIANIQKCHFLSARQFPPLSSVATMCLCMCMCICIMYMCVCLHMYMHMQMSIKMYMCMYTYTYKQMYMCMCVCKCICQSICICVCICVCIRIHIRIRIRARVRVRALYVYVYVQVYLYLLYMYM
jgi:hypothetical protein